MERNPLIRPLRPIPAPPLDEGRDTPAAENTPAQWHGEGRLLFQITTAGGAIPLEGAEITLRKSESPAAPGGDVLAVVFSGRDGKTEILTLPAPSRGYSLEPARDGAPVPYALYNADVRMEGFYKQSYIRIPVFDGITSIQRASLIPLPENGFEGGTRPDGETFVEGESPEL